jgi:hypothetical protein
MAQGKRIQVVLPPQVAETLKKQAGEQQRTVSNYAAYLIEAAIRNEK